jgi:hypothetical protein
MRNDSIVSELRQARPIAPADVEPPLDVCERILATPPAVVRRRERRWPVWRGWSARTLALAPGTLTLTGAATAATIIASHAPTPNGKEVAGPTGYVAYWQDGKLTPITDCAKTPSAIELSGRPRPAACDRDAHPERDHARNLQRAGPRGSGAVPQGRRWRARVRRSPRLLIHRRRAQLSAAMSAEPKVLAPGPAASGMS